MLVNFFLAFVFFQAFPLIFPSLHLTFFAPYLIRIYYRRDFTQALWKAAFVGLIVDLFSSHHFGLTSFNYVCVTLLIYRFKKMFFEDSLSTLPLMTFFFSLFSTCMDYLLHLFFGKTIHFSPSSFLCNCAGMAVLDALYALIFFSLSFKFFKHLTKLRT